MTHINYLLLEVQVPLHEAVQDPLQAPEHAELHEPVHPEQPPLHDPEQELEQSSFNVSVACNAIGVLAKMIAPRIGKVAREALRKKSLRDFKSLLLSTVLKCSASRLEMKH